MKSTLKRMLNKPLIPVFVALIALAGVAAQAQTPDGSLTADVSLATGRTMSQGQPLILKYKISNVSDGLKEMGMRIAGPDWLSLRLSDATGRTIQGHEPVDPNDATAHPGLFNGGEISGHSSFEDYVIVSQWFPALEPGRYTLTVNVRIPYEDVTHTTLEQDIHFPLLVTRMDPIRVQAAAQALAEAAARTPADQAAKRQMLVGALFSMPEAQAVPSWRKITSSPSSSVALLSDAVRDLGYLQTTTATDILLDMRLAPALTKDVYLQTDIAGALAGAYRDGKPSLRQYIREAYASRGVPLSVIVGVPGKAGGGN